jgi:SRSO17 transposase
VIKKGGKSVGVAPQHCGATGQTENCQVLPMLSYASAGGHAFIDRALYLPRRWTDDPQRCAQAGVPAERGFATKPELVIDMLDRALAAGVPFRYVTADSGYGRDPALRARCHAAGGALRGGLRAGRPGRSAAGRAFRSGHPSGPGARDCGGLHGVGAPLLRPGHQGRPLPRLG